MSSYIDIVEVGPRDGFQNLKQLLSTNQKIDIIERLLACGMKHLQITSFVSPKAIPQMHDAAEVCAAILGNHQNEKLNLYALVPNLRGAQMAYQAGLRRVNTVISLSASHNRANINRTHHQSFEELSAIRTKFPDMDVVLDIATAFGCPFEGKYHDSAPLMDFIQRGISCGVTCVNLCDTVGLSDPAQVRRVVRLVKENFPTLRVEIHIHDTRGMGLVNTLAAIEAGVHGVQATLGGLGGCPFAPGASGNTATEDLVHMLHEMGYDTGIDLEALIQTSRYQHQMAESGVFSGHLLHLQPSTGGCCNAREVTA